MSTATGRSPQPSPTAVDHVLINGEVVVKNKRFVKAQQPAVERRISKWREANGGLNRNLQAVTARVRAFFRQWDEPGPVYRYNYL